jgi:hypothetical protein
VPRQSRPKKPKYYPGGMNNKPEYTPEWKEIEDVCTRGAASLVSCRRYHLAAQLLEIADRARMRQTSLEVK